MTVFTRNRVVVIRSAESVLVVFAGVADSVEALGEMISREAASGEERDASGATGEMKKEGAGGDAADSEGGSATARGGK